MTFSKEKGEVYFTVLNDAHFLRLGLKIHFDIKKITI